MRRWVHPLYPFIEIFQWLLFMEFITQKESFDIGNSQTLKQIILYTEDESMTFGNCYKTTLPSEQRNNFE